MFNERIALADLKERVPNLDYCLWNCLETDTSSYNQSSYTFDLLRCIPSSVHRISVNPCETMTSTWTANRLDSSSESWSPLFSSDIALRSDIKFLFSLQATASKFLDYCWWQHKFLDSQIYNLGVIPYFLCLR